jgi:GTP-binding protein
VSGGYRPVIIATKADKIKRSQLQRQIRQIRETLELPDETDVIPFSAVSKNGRDAILAKMGEAVAKRREEASDQQD